MVTWSDLPPWSSRVLSVSGTISPVVRFFFWRVSQKIYFVKSDFTFTIHCDVNLTSGDFLAHMSFVAAVLCGPFVFNIGHCFCLCPTRLRWKHTMLLVWLPCGFQHSLLWWFFKPHFSQRRRWNYRRLIMWLTIIWFTVCIWLIAITIRFLSWFPFG